MSAGTELTFDGVEPMPLKVFTEKAYLDYSMYVILDRALPHIGDGLKPVQRRIIYAMSELGLKAGTKYKKSARTVGDVLGKYHPHGDSACYEAMVLMAQPFSYRYPLVDGQGNWGSPDDPKSFAAMRYTEARLAKFAELLLAEVGMGTVDWVPNFDGTMSEPSLLPARVPHVLLNGTTGIAVGMATDIPPHNLREVASACIHLLDEPEASISQLMKHVKGPDYPTDAEIITPRADIKKIYETGHGSIKLRARYVKEDSDIIITTLPHQVSGAKILEQIAQQMNAKKLPMVADLRDESDHENPTRLVIVPRSNRIDVEQLMAHLFATTDLERNYRVNMNVIGINGKPQVKNLQEMLSEWLAFRTETVRCRLQHRLDKVLARLHILDGLLVAFLNIDEVIHIIHTEEKPKQVLMARFKISDDQAEAILELKLRHLAKLEEMKIRGEQDELSQERDSLEKTLKSKARMKTLIKNELTADAEEYGDKRRSPIVEREAAQAMSESELITSDPITVILSERGWIRSAKGHDLDVSSLTYKSGDGFRATAQGKSNQPTVLIDSTGRTYSMPSHNLPSARSHGEPLSGRLNPPDGSSFEGVMLGTAEQNFVLATSHGYGFVTSLGEMYAKNKSGKAVLTVPKGAKVLTPTRVHNMESDWLAVVTSEGRLLVFPITELPVLGKGKGNKLIGIPSDELAKGADAVVDVISIPENGKITIYSGKRHISYGYYELESYEGERGRRGSKLPRGFQKVDRMVLELG